MTIRILLVDDHAMVRMGIKSLLSSVSDLSVVGEAESGEKALILVREVNPDVILMDVSMPGMGGLEATKRLIQRDAQAKVLVVTAHGAEPYPSKVLQAGAMGYITKGAALEEMLTAIRSVAQGKRYLSPEIAQQLALKHLNGDSGASPFDQLSERELQILIMVTSGQKVPDIAEQLCLSPKTVNSYRYRLFEKLNIHSDVELTHLAMQHGLIDLN